MKKAIASFILFSALLLIFFAAAAGASAPDSAEASASQPDYENASYIYDEASGIRLDLDRETLDGFAFGILRNYYNDQSLTDDILFEKFTDLKISYVNALENLYNTNNLGKSGSAPETAMKIYYEGREKLFGLDANVYLYNIVIYEGLKKEEQTHLDIILPVHSTYSIVTARFTIPQDQLGKPAAEIAAAMLSAVRYDGLSPQNEAPGVLLNSRAVEDARLGIYPAASQEDPVYIGFMDTTAGYSLSLPDKYVKFVKNNLGGAFTYTSFKIDPNTIFSISSELRRGGGANDAINRTISSALKPTEFIDSGSRRCGDNNFSFISYSADVDGVRNYFHIYFLEGVSRLYKLQLQSSYKAPGSAVEKQMEKILASLELSDMFSSSTVYAGRAETGFNEYTNREEGYGFMYPDTWKLEDISPDISRDWRSLIVPGYSGALKITFQESRLKTGAGQTDILENTEGSSISSWPNAAEGYEPPFFEKTSKLLFSDFNINGPVTTIYRLGVFTDENGRNRLCYSVDILRGRKIYSMFITTGGYRTTEGRFENEEIDGLLNLVASSFGLRSTPESEAKRFSGDSRNRKLIFAEKQLKALIDQNLMISSVEKLQPDGTSIVTVDNTGDSGYYKIKLDYENRNLELVDRVLKRDILISELERIKEEYKGQTVSGTFRNESNMTIAVESIDLVNGKTIRVFWVSVSKKDGDITWKTVRVANQEDYKKECGEYVKSLFSSDTETYIYGDDVFSDLDIYSRKGLDYRFLVYYKSKQRAGFMVLSMNPVTSAFKPLSSFIPVTAAVQNIKTLYGIDSIVNYQDRFTFDPESFTLTLNVRDGAGNSNAEMFKIYYHPEENTVKYDRLNRQNYLGSRYSPQPDRH